MDSSSEDFEDLNCIEEVDLDDGDDLSEDGPTKKPHFLDYDAAPPTGEELQFSCYSSLPESSSRNSLRSATATPAANDLDKNNTSEKTGPSSLNVLSSQQSGAAEISSNSAQFPSKTILLTRRRSATEVQPSTAAVTLLPNTGTRKKQFPAFNGRAGGREGEGHQQRYSQSLDYESVPIDRLDRR